jgi:hypothetical protein
MKQLQDFLGSRGGLSPGAVVACGVVACSIDAKDDSGRAGASVSSVLDCLTNCGELCTPLCLWPKRLQSIAYRVVLSSTSINMLDDL